MEVLIWDFPYKPPFPLIMGNLHLETSRIFAAWRNAAGAVWGAARSILSLQKAPVAPVAPVEPVRHAGLLHLEWWANHLVDD